MDNRIKYLTILGMLAAIGFAVSVAIRINIIPGAPFLTYDPKDVAILLGGFMYGPLAAMSLSFVLAILEMPISGTGLIGALMNFLSSASFTVTAALVYSRHRNIIGAITGLTLGIIAVAVTMIGFNYIMMPIFTPAISREMVVGMILPVLLPFNILKPALNAAAALILYKHVTKALKAARLLPLEKSTEETNPQKLTRWVMPIAALVIIALIILIIFIN